ncbi:prolyl oligopeptidase family serine peptidase [Streptomyces sp. SP18CS02]|uniref:prolyl oligopeptidase family serine peptidase n=1 Tax=Streptomyces sp. SP18CS02 TaxID=3002531 RepID=UPI002E76555B|nr:prolyl oligopeptidase family serine peptidase [Streptomyces sp. SP18CS02]MEE1754701.1 prolyl oligopeptidase family serine peptidase [Streptomyces sp. SP18CS02]
MAADARNPLTGAEAGAGAGGAPGPAVTGGTGSGAGPVRRLAACAAPTPLPLADAQGPRDAPQPLIAHGCWYPSADPTGEHVAFICDRTGVPQLWTGPAAGGEPHLLDSDPDPVTEVAWSPDGRWIAYTTAPGGGEHTRVLCVRPDGSRRRILAGAEPGSSAHLGCWTRDGSALAVTVAGPPVARWGEGGTGTAAEPGFARPDAYAVELPPGWSGRDGPATLLGGARWGDVTPGPSPEEHRDGTGPDGRDTLAAYLIDLDGPASPTLIALERGAATLRVCDVSGDGRLALLRRGPRGRREAVVLRMSDLRTSCVVPVADGDPWIGRFSPDGRTVWLRSDHRREFAALLAAALDRHGQWSGMSVVAEREGCDLELLAFAEDGRQAVLAWNVQGVSRLETLALPADGGPATRPRPSPATGTARAGAGARGAEGTGTEGSPGPPVRRAIPLPHEVVTRIGRSGPRGAVLALSGSQRRPGVWWLPGAAPPARTSWSSRDQDAVPPGRRPVRPTRLRLKARDGLPLAGWYYRAPGRKPGAPAPCVVHLHGGPEEQERPVLDPLYHELLGRGLDVFAPDVRGSSGSGRSFTDADLGAGRFAAIDDVADCAAHAVLSGLADPRRLAVMGRSYGGYLTLASLTWHPEVFRTGVAVCGMSDFSTFFAGTEPWIAESASHKYGHPEHDAALLRSLSPMSRVDDLRVPLLAVHGEHDTNVPPGESEQFVRAARERGHAAELLTLRDEGHDFLRAENRRLFRRAAADWMERHLRS